MLIGNRLAFALDADATKLSSAAGTATVASLEQLTKS
jgi:hypothetical protein